MSKMDKPVVIQKPRIERIGEALDFLRSKGAKLAGTGFYSEIGTALYFEGIALSQVKVNWEKFFEKSNPQPAGKEGC